jgi:acetylornithine deacetylase/succinyl-diaminopimelate desuccinylase-like protein
MPAPERHFLTVGDTSRPLETTLKDSDGPVTIPASATLQFRMRHIGAQPGDTKVAAAAVRIDDGSEPLRGKVRYSFVDADVDEVGHFVAKIRVTYVDGKRETYPNKGYITADA